MQRKLASFKHILFPGTGCLTYLLLSAKAGNRLSQICARKYVMNLVSMLLYVKHLTCFSFCGVRFFSFYQNNLGNLFRCTYLR